VSRASPATAPRFESELAGPVGRHLESLGFQVWVDPDGTDYFDVVARRGEELGLVELKLSDWRELLAQAVDRRGYGDWVAVAMPRSGPAERLVARASVGNARRIGVWVVEGESVRVLRPAERWPTNTRELFRGQREALERLLEVRSTVPEDAPGMLTAFPPRTVRRPGGRSARNWRLEEFPPAESGDPP